MRYYVHCPLPPKITKRISKIEKQYQDNSRSKPHITIIYPREMIAGRSESELIDVIQSTTKKLKPFVITQIGVDYLGKKEVICVRVKRSKALIACNKAFTKAVNELLDNPTTKFAHLPKPHITLAARLSKQSAKKVWKSLKNQKFSGQFLCKKVNLLRMKKGDRRWRVIATFTLDG